MIKVSSIEKMTFTKVISIELSISAVHRAELELINCLIGWLSNDTML